MKSVLNSSFILTFSLIFVSWLTLLSSHRAVAFSLNSEGEALLSLLNSFTSASVPDSIKLSWNFSTSSTPCEWFGITCNTQNTHVVSLNLNYSGIYGQFGPQIGRLRYLKSLDLSGNHFSGPIPIELWNCSHLQHLDLSFDDRLLDLSAAYSGFSGQLGPQIEQLRYLKYLDLSVNNFSGPIPIELWNCFHLQHLGLYFNNFTGELPEAVRNLHQLKYFNISWNQFGGGIPKSLFQISGLESVGLNFNHFSGSIPNELWNCSRLQGLDISGNNFTGGIPKSLFQISGLESVDLGYNNFTGSIPKELWNCSSLRYLDLSRNHFTGELPETVRNLHLLISFIIFDNQLNGRIPESLFEISGLVEVDVGQNNFSGSIPVNIGNATNMVRLLLRDNHLHGNIPTSIANCTGLSFLYLNNDGLSGEIPLGVWRIPTLAYFVMNNNNLSGVLPVEMTTVEMTTGLLHHLRYIDLSNNHFSGSIPEALGINSTSLWWVDFSNNSFSGEIPPNLCFGKQLEKIDLGLNQFHGSIPSSYTGNCYSLIELDLRGNNLTDPLPEFEKYSRLRTLGISGNNIHGKIPSSICNLVSNYFFSLDFSENNMNGTLPQCLGDSNHLYTLNLRNNDFSGSLPLEFTSGELYMLDLNGNRFQGKIPRIRSPKLQYLDLGNNQLKDTFPFFLGEILSNSLEILVLRSNKLYGPLTPLRTYLNFTQLKVLDISSNYFTGDLPLEFYLGLEAMKNIYNVEEYIYNGDFIRYPPIKTVIIHKGKEMTLNRTFIGKFRAIDMSNNTLQGTISESIGELVWLKMLNLSGNNLTGHIPSSIGNLRQLESLDLSQNKLSGEIPRHFTDIQSLSVFNLSHNNLTGRIPNGRQFQTFSNDSFGGNHGLCGLPLLTKCKDDVNNESHQDPFEVKEGDSDSNNSWNFGWEPVAIGYGCGVLIGLVLQYFVFTKAFLYRWFG